MAMRTTNLGLPALRSFSLNAARVGLKRLTLEKGHDRIDGGATFGIEALAATPLVDGDVLCDLPEPCGQGLEVPLLFVRGRHWFEALGLRPLV